MAKPTVGGTALRAATCRIIEQYQPDETRLFDDPVVKHLVGAPIRALVRFAGMRNYALKKTDAVARGLYGAQVCRTRYIDDAVRAAVSRGIRQLVILGAGLDTRPYRLAGLEVEAVFEVDLPQVQEDKRKKIEKYLGRPPERVTFVQVDFEAQGPDTILAGTAFNLGRPAVFVWEGVTQYITEEAVRRTLAFVGASAPGSQIVFTYVLKSVIERRSDIPGAVQMVDLVARNAPWVFGLEPAAISSFLKVHHLALLEDVGDADYQEKYLKPMGRKLAVFEGERIASRQCSDPARGRSKDIEEIQRFLVEVTRPMRARRAREKREARRRYWFSM